MNVHIMIETRLLHGQVGIQWADHYHAKTIWVANDEVVNDEIVQKVMKMAAPSDCQVIFSSVADCTPTEEDTLILVNQPSDALALCNQGIVFDEVLVRNMEKKENTVQAAERVYISAQDTEAFGQLKEKGIACIIQRFPDAVVEDNANLFEPIQKLSS